VERWLKWHPGSKAVGSVWLNIMVGRWFGRSHKNGFTLGNDGVSQSWWLPSRNTLETYGRAPKRVA